MTLRRFGFIFAYTGVGLAISMILARWGLPPHFFGSVMFSMFMLATFHERPER